MGLDSFVYSSDVAPDLFISSKERVKYEKEEIMYWRKHYNLHSWMEHLHFKKYGKTEDMFNCVYLDLDKPDLLKLKKEIYRLNDYDDDDEEYAKVCYKRDLEFIKNAISLINEGKYIYYFSWW